MRKRLFKLFLACCLCISCSDKNDIEQIKLESDKAKNEVIIYKNKILLLQDSINNQQTVINNLIIYKDSVNTINKELFLIKYKLERIREYNNIAANGNNIKFLRGWINRTLND